MADLHDYIVSAHLRAQGWEAEIRRRDGKKMRIEGTTKLVFTTTIAPSSSEAIGLAYRTIDEILPAGWI